jgi:hypothetical protein
MAKVMGYGSWVWHVVVKYIMAYHTRKMDYSWHVFV